MTSPLDNPFWHALVGPQRHHALGTGPARRYAPDFASQAAVASPDEAAFEALGDLVDEGGTVDLFLGSPRATPTGWSKVFEVELQQMVCGRLAEAPAHDFVELGEADVPEMLALAEATHPGPFRPGGVSLGRFIGIREGGRLVAMGGERANPPGHREISGVCTLPERRRRGYARALVHELATRRLREGATPFLHVELANVDAIRLYERMGFTTRRRFHVVVLRREATSARRSGVA